MIEQGLGPRSFFVASALLFAILAGELVCSIRQEAQTFDESAHLYSGYAYWKLHDFGVNPEHPPLAKLVTSLPFLAMGLPIKPAPPVFFRAASTLAGKQFLYSQNADLLLFRARMMMSIFTFLLALLLVAAGYEMFGPPVGLIALALFVFEPNLLAHGALVTTDMPVTAMLFATMYTFYRYLTRPSVPRLLVCAVSAGVALTVKHSGLLLFPMLLLITAADILLAWKTEPQSRARRSLRLLGSLAVISAVAFTILWSSYGFRYAARPGGAPLVPPTAAFLKTLHSPAAASAIGFGERHHILPEAYLYGLTDIAVGAREGRPTFLLGKAYSTGRWFYFPAAILIKSTIGFLVLLALAACFWSPWRKRKREALILLIPVGLYMLSAIRSRLDIGLRHVLPIYPFLIVVTAAAAWALTRKSRKWVVAIGLLLVLHAASSLRAYPAYLAYSNEIWGGPSATYKVLSDSNAGWGSGLKAMQRYIRDHGIQNCWFAYSGAADLSYFHLPCKTTPTFFSVTFGTAQEPVPEVIQGPIFIASERLPEVFLGPPQVDPYVQFMRLKPDAVLDGSILVFNGTFHVREVSGFSHFAIANGALRAGRIDVAFQEAQQAEAIAPDLLMAHEMLTSLYEQSHRPAEARGEYERALQVYRTEYGDFAEAVKPPQPPAGPVAAVAAQTSTAPAAAPR